MTTSSKTDFIDVPDLPLGRLKLRQELRALTTLDRTNHCEAIVFHCARILEASVFQVFRKYGIETQVGDLYPRLAALSQERWLSEFEFHAMDALRRMGNDARHINRQITGVDVTFALWSVNLVLHWYFKINGELVPSALSEIFDSDVLRTAYSSLCDVEDGMTDDASRQMAIEISSSPVLFSLLLERLIDRGKTGIAIELIDKASKEIKEYRRVVLLQALAHSRSGLIEDALSIIERRLNKDKGLLDSGDAAGIYAGCLKRAWKETDSVDKLKRAAEQYLLGWNNRKQRDVYLGINAAACALWLGRREDAIQTAKEVRAELAEFDGKARPDAVSALEASPWRTLTRAESDLLAGDVSKAAKKYRDLFDQLGSQEGRLASAKWQLRVHLEKLGITSRSVEFGLEP